MSFLPHSSAARKNLPVTTGVLDYFPDAIAYVAFVSKVGNDKHNPGEPLHWSRGKSDDHIDCVGRHLIERGTYEEGSGVLHDGMLAWRALANLQITLEELRAKGYDVWALFGGQTPAQKAPEGHAAGCVTATVTINEHAHGDDHHEREDKFDNEALRAHSG